MAIDESGWADLDDRLAGVGGDAAAREALVDALTSRLVAHFGADVVECHHGKNDPTRHAMREVAAASIAHLAETLDPDRFDRVTPIDPPWDDAWRADARTASWRS